MTYQLKEGQGSLFKNTKKISEKHPNATGSCLIGGVDYWISSWTKEGKGGKFQSLSFKPKTEQYVKGARRDPPDEDIPF